MQTAPAPTAVDLTGLEALRQRAAHDDPQAAADAAVQFEALFIGLMLKTARDASLGNGVGDGFDTRQYLDLMDQQVALEVARNGGLGFGDALVKQLTRATPAVPAAAQGPIAPPATEPRPVPLGAAGAQSGGAVRAAGGSAAAEPLANTGASQTVGLQDEPAAGSLTASEFVARLWPEAAAAGKALGVEPRLLLAQAALETGWGGAAPTDADGTPANNLFGIKAGASWGGARAAHWTIENRDGIAERKRETFRAYPSTAASFADYVDVISAPRYATALANAADPEAYARAVTAAGYATDPNYADKWLSIYRGDRLDGAMRDLKPATFGPTQ